MCHVILRPGVLVTDNIPEKVRHLLDMSPEQDVVPVLDHTTYSLKNREKSRYHNNDEIMQILANHQLGNSVAELPTQENQPEETKTDKSTESLVDGKLIESSVGKSADWKKSDWKDWSDNSYILASSVMGNQWNQLAQPIVTGEGQLGQEAQDVRQCPERGHVEEEAGRLLHHALPWNPLGHLVLPRRLLLH